MHYMYDDPPKVSSQLLLLILLFCIFRKTTSWIRTSDPGAPRLLELIILMRTRIRDTCLIRNANYSSTSKELVSTQLGSLLLGVKLVKARRS